MSLKRNILALSNYIYTSSALLTISISYMVHVDSWT